MGKDNVHNTIIVNSKHFTTGEAIRMSDKDLAVSYDQKVVVEIGPKVKVSLNCRKYFGLIAEPGFDYKNNSRLNTYIFAPVIPNQYILDMIHRKINDEAKDKILLARDSINDPISLAGALRMLVDPVYGYKDFVWMTWLPIGRNPKECKCHDFTATFSDN